MNKNCDNALDSVNTEKFFKIVFFEENRFIDASIVNENMFILKDFLQWLIELDQIDSLNLNRIQVVLLVIII